MNVPLSSSEHIPSLFPGGIKRVTVSSFNLPPADGVLISEENAETAKANLSKGTVIVALDGIQVHNFDQFTYARDSVTTQGLDLIVWQDNQYHEVKAKPPGRRFGVHMPDYKRN
jgi:S1-C subfamily serine protease